MNLEILFPSVVLFILIIMGIISMGYPPTPRLFPLIVIIITAILVAIRLIKEVWGKPKQEGGSNGKKMMDKATLTQYFWAPVWIGAFLSLIYLIGYLGGTALFNLFYLKLNGLKWRTTIFFTIGVIAFMYGCFQIALKITLYEGFLFK